MKIIKQIVANDEPKRTLVRVDVPIYIPFYGTPSNRQVLEQTLIYLRNCSTALFEHLGRLSLLTEEDRLQKVEFTEIVNILSQFGKGSILAIEESQDEYKRLTKQPKPKSDDPLDLTHFNYGGLQ